MYYTQTLLGSTVVSPYVGMARKQNGGYNASTVHPRLSEPRKFG